MTKSKIQYSFERLKREFPLPIAIGRRGRRGCIGSQRFCIGQKWKQWFFNTFDYFYPTS